MKNFKFMKLAYAALEILGNIASVLRKIKKNNYHFVNHEYCLKSVISSFNEKKIRFS